MTSDYLNHVRSLKELHEIIERDHTSGSLEAIERLAQDVQAVAGKIAGDAERMMARVYSEAEAESAKLTAKTATTVSKINNDATKAAADLIAHIQPGDNSKDAAMAANTLLKDAENRAPSYTNGRKSPLPRLPHGRNLPRRMSSRLPMRQSKN
jgi:hypothetical protein